MGLARCLAELCATLADTGAPVAGIGTRGAKYWDCGSVSAPASTSAGTAPAPTSASKQTPATPIVSVDQMLNARSSQAPLQQRPVLLSFDDGCTSVYNQAFPLLKRCRAGALAFLTQVRTQIGSSPRPHG